MPIPTESIGSIPRLAQLLEAMTAHARGQISDRQLRAAEDTALRETIARFEETNSLVITDERHYPAKPPCDRSALSAIQKSPNDWIDEGRYSELGPNQTPQ